MKKYVRIILIGSLLLLIFPLLALPELWEQLYVIIIGFVMGTAALLLRHKSGLMESDDSEQSLQDYVTELQTRFRDHKKHDEIKKVSPQKPRVEISEEKEVTHD